MYGNNFEAILISNLNKLVFTINYCYEKQIVYFLSYPGKESIIL